MVRTIVCRCVAVGIGVASVARAQTPAQPLQLADRGPAFYEVGVSDGARVDARHAAVLTQRILLRLHDATIPDALVVIGEQAGLRFTYDQALLPRNVHVSLRADDITVAAALTQILLDANLDIEIMPTGLASLVARVPRTRVAMQQVGTVTGHITDAATHRPIPYATVIVEDTKWATTANDSGVYRITGLRIGTYTILARSLGYLPLRHATTVDQSQSVDFALAKSPSQLDQVVVTGTIIPTEVRAVPTPVTVISDTDIAAQHPHDVQELFRQAVPTAVSWDEAPYPALTAFSVRGASTMNGGTGQMKVFVDGIETAYRTNAGVDPNSIARIEVIRGPEAAAIYGSDAAGGVIQIFTKRGDPTLGGPQVDVQTAAGLVQTPFVGHRAVPREDYTASLRGAGADVSYNVGGGYAHTADYIPYGETSAQTTASAFGGMHYARGPVTADISGRYYEQDNPSIFNPAFIPTGLAYFTKPFFQPSPATDQTVGTRFSVAATSWWQHTVTAGVDGLTLTSVQSRRRLTTPADTEFGVYNQTWTRTTVGYNTSAHAMLSANIAGSVTLGIDHYSYPINEYITSGALNTSGSIVTDPSSPVSAAHTITSNTGYFAQGQMGFWDALFLTAGIRGEQNSDFGDSLRAPVSPRFGISYVRPIAMTTIKVRASYGTAIRPPDPGNKLPYVSVSGIVLANPRLGPERQGGGDVGVDVQIGSRVSLGATYYDQTAENLIQVVQLPSGSVPINQYQNIGTVKNTGLELEGGVSASVVQVRAQYGYTRSRVDHLLPTYGGDLHIGDQSLLTPKHTAGVSIALAPLKGTAVTGGVTYVGSWRNYDYIAEFRCFGGTGPCTPTSRGYIVDYPSIVKIHATVSQQITRWVSGFVSVDNLTNNDAYENSNFVPEIGRVTTIGLRLHN